MDFEQWERDSTMTTEFGFSLTKWEDGTAVGERGHYVVKEYRGYRNGQYVQDNRDVWTSHNLAAFPQANLLISTTISERRKTSRRRA